MPKLKPIESALHDWVHTLTFQQQALLMTGMRGPDTCNKHNPAKAIIRYLRGAICKPAGNWSYGNDNDFMWGQYQWFGSWQKQFLDDPDGYPHHFIMHLIHCAEVIGYKHPDDVIAGNWLDFYHAGCKAFHMWAEEEHEMDERLNDFGVPIPSAPVSSPSIETEIGPDLGETIDWMRQATIRNFRNSEGAIDVNYYEGYLNALEELRNEMELSPSIQEAPEHVHVQLPSGGVAGVSTDASDELLGALDQMVKLAQEAPAIGPGNEDVPTMSFQLAAEADQAALDFGRLAVSPDENTPDGSELTDAYMAGQSWMWRKLSALSPKADTGVKEVPEEIKQLIEKEAEYLKYPDLKIPFRSGAITVYKYLSDKLLIVTADWNEQLASKDAEIELLRKSGATLRPDALFKELHALAFWLRSNKEAQERVNGIIEKYKPIRE